MAMKHKGSLQITKDLTIDNGLTVVSGMNVAGLEYPTSDGSINQVIETDGAGNLSFVSITHPTAVDSLNAQTGTVTITGTTGVNTITVGGVVTLTTQDDEIDHDGLLNFSASEHFTEASIDHTAIQNIGINTHAQIDTHLGDLATSGTTNSADIATNTVNIDANTVSGTANAAEILTVSGHLQTEIDALGAAGVDSVNDVTGEVLVTGTQNVTTQTLGQTITVTGPDLSSYGTTAELLTVSGHLQTQITTNTGDIATNVSDIAANTALVTTTSGHLQTQIDAVEGSDVDSINAQTGAVTITGTTGVNTATAGGVITLTSEDSEIDHDALQNYDADEHRDWTADQGATDIHDGNVAESSVTQHEGAIDHDALTNFAANEHFTEASIDHTAITNIGSNSHSAIDTHIADATLHFTEGSIDHTAITNVGSNTHAQIDTHLLALAASGVVTDANIVSVSGHLQAEIDAIEASDVDSVNAQTGAVTITGAVGVDTITAGGVITLNSVDGEIDHDALLNYDSNEHFTEGSIDHTAITNIGVNTHAQIDTHLGALAASGTAHEADATIHFTEGSIDHTAISNIGSNSHAALDTHVADATLHFTEGSIDHTAISNIGSNSHATIDTHIADGTIHFTEGSIDHTAITNVGANTHAAIDTHLLALAASGVATDSNIVSVSGHLQAEIDATQPDVDALTVSGGAQATGVLDFVGDNGVNVSRSGQTITFDGAGIEAGGGGAGTITSINTDATGPAVTITGVGTVNTLTVGNVITVSGTDHTAAGAIDDLALKLSAEAFAL